MLGEYDFERLDGLVMACGEILMKNATMDGVDPLYVLAELCESEGYVKGNLEPLGSSPAEGGGIEFYFRAWGEGDDEHTSFVAEPWMLEDQGWIKVPDCEDCSGTGRWPVAASKVAFTSESCPSCAGTGKQRGVFVSRSQLESWLADSDKQHDLEASFERLLAVLEGETDE